MTDAVSGAGGAVARGSAGPPASTSEAHGEAPQEDRDILYALTRGDQRLALALCVQRHGASIGRLCMAMLGSQVDADDVTQETLLTAHEAFDDYRGDGSIRAWLLGIARKKCLKHLERARRRGSRVSLAGDGEHLDGISAAELDGERSRAEADLSARRLGEEARELLSRVKPSERDVLILRYCAGLSFKEVAEACGIAEAAARKRVSRALSALRSALKDEDDND